MWPGVECQSLMEEGRVPAGWFAYERYPLGTDLFCKNLRELSNPRRSSPPLVSQTPDPRRQSTIDTDNKRPQQIWEGLEETMTFLEGEGFGVKVQEFLQEHQRKSIRGPLWERRQSGRGRRSRAGAVAGPWHTLHVVSRGGG